MAVLSHTDDQTVLGEAVIWRRVPPWHVIFDPKVGGCRPTKSAFDDSDGTSPMSACLAGQATSLDQLLAGLSEFAVVALSMAVVRSKNLGIVRDPRENEPDHVLIFGKKTDSVRRSLARECRWVIPPPISVCKTPGGCVCFPRKVQ